MTDKDEIDEIIEEVNLEEEEEEDDDTSKRTVKKIVKRSEGSHGFLSRLSKEDVILGILFVGVGIFLGYIIFKALNKSDRKDRYFPQMPVLGRHSPDFPPPPPVESSFIDQPRRGRHSRKTRHGLNMDLDSGDLILDEPSKDEHWLVKRNMFGEIIDCYKIYDDETLK